MQNIIQPKICIFKYYEGRIINGENPYTETAYQS